MKIHPPEHYHQPKITIFFILLGMIATVAMEFYLPAMQQMAKHFNASIADIQITLTIFILGVGVGQLLAGSLSDRFGRFPILIVGIILYVIAAVICIFGNLDVIIIARFFQAIGAACAIVVYRIMIADTHDKQQSALKINTTMGIVLLGLAIGPVIGGYVTHFFGWRMCFIVMAVYGVVLLFGSMFILGETLQDKNPHAFKPRVLLANYSRMFSTAAYRRYMLCIIAMMSMFFMFITEAPVLLGELFHLSSRMIGWNILLVMMGFVIGVQIAKRLIKTMEIDRVIKLGIIVALMATIAGMVLYFTIGDSLWLLNTVMLFVYLAVGLAYGNCLASAYKLFPDMLGATASFTGFLQFGGVFIFSSLIAALPSHSLVTLFGLNLVLAVGLGVLLLKPTFKRDS